MITSRIKNQVKQALYTPKKSRVINSKNLKAFGELEKNLSESFGSKKGKVDDKDKDKDKDEKKE